MVAAMWTLVMAVQPVAGDMVTGVVQCNMAILRMVMVATDIVAMDMVAMDMVAMDMVVMDMVVMDMVVMVVGCGSPRPISAYAWAIRFC